MFCNSIYETLKDVAGVKDPRKIALAYVHASLRAGKERIIVSKDPIIDEGQNVYVLLDRMGRTILDTEAGEKNIEDIVRGRLDDSNYTPREGTVEEVLWQIFGKYEFEEAVDKIGQVLHRLVTGRPNFNKPVEEIGARRIQRYEQRQIRGELSEYLDSGK